MNESVVGLSKGVLSACGEAVETTLAETDGMIFAMIATVDGSSVASAMAPGWDISENRMAAMASTGHALGDSVSKELTDAACQNVIIDANKISIVFMSISGFQNPPLILGVAATKSTSLGSVLHGANRCVRSLNELVVEMPAT